MLCRSYNYENEPLKRIVGDFVEYVLLLKPSDIVCFAIKYFTAFGRERQRNYSSQASTSSKHTDEMEDHKNLITEEGEEREEKEFTGFGESERLFFGEG